jgi:hypothetical protein
VVRLPSQNVIIPTNDPTTPRSRQPNRGQASAVLDVQQYSRPSMIGACTSRSMSHGGEGEVSGGPATQNSRLQGTQTRLRRGSGTSGRGHTKIQQEGQQQNSPSIVLTASDLCGWWAWDAPSRPSCQYIIATLSPPLARQRSDVRGLIGNGLRRSGLSFPSPHAEPHTVCVHAY